MFRSLIKNNLLTEINAPREHAGLAWRQAEDGTWIVARITDEGLRAIGIDPNEGEGLVKAAATEGAPTGEEGAGEGGITAPGDELDSAALTPTPSVQRQSLRAAAEAAVTAWQAQAGPPPSGTHFESDAGRFGNPLPIHSVGTPL